MANSINRFLKKEMRRAREDKLKYAVNPMVASVKTTSNTQPVQEAGLQSNRRESMFVAKETPDEELSEEEQLGDGLDIIKKRRGTIFGNETGTMFGN